MKSQNFVLFSRRCLVWTSQFGVSGFSFRVRNLRSRALRVFLSFGRGSTFLSRCEKTSGPPRRHFWEVRNSHPWWGNVESWFTKGNSYQCLVRTSQLKSQNFVLFSRQCLGWTSQFGVSGFWYFFVFPEVEVLGTGAIMTLF